jgi:hypothetical protein
MGIFQVTVVFLLLRWCFLAIICSVHKVFVYIAILFEKLSYYLLLGKYDKLHFKVHSLWCWSLFADRGHKSSACFPTCFLLAHELLPFSNLIMQVYVAFLPHLFSFWPPKEYPSFFNVNFSCIHWETVLILSQPLDDQADSKWMHNIDVFFEDPVHTSHLPLPQLPLLPLSH